ncbi:peptide MFS transporter [Sphingomonas oligoaromativorans]|uniref:peptide MFS transporter n=1 Tax=Sphingomonas oligoaromativorans TaxID=575322 RepID=UPI00141F940C|nr:peptide MFS transporter [Sphingomonas oligoaromativorans]NIJ31940.1 POT family proton-dependent oligopeptide transporter [Sphingomonas oligoaromativorans]
MVLPDADATFEPGSPHVSRSDGGTWLGHPRQLARLFSVEAWERFGFYGLRALLVLYLTNHFLLSDREANGLYGGYMSLVYLTPVVGGLIADRYLGSKRSVKFGAIVMAVGYFLLCFGGQPAKPFAVIDGQRYEVTEQKASGDTKLQFITAAGQHLRIKGQPDGSVQLLADDGHVARTVAKRDFSSDAHRSPFYVTLMLFALSLIVVGNGFFKPNISTIVGSLYAEGDRRRDAGFTIFYWGINIGSIGSQTFCPVLVTMFGWWAGFLLAAIGMLFAYALIRFDGGRLAGYGEPPVQEGKDRAAIIYILAILAAPITWLVLRNVMEAPEAAAGAGFVGYLLALPVLGKVLFVTFLAAVVGIPVWAWRAGTRAEFQMMLAAVILVVFNVTFWTLFEQAGSSLTLFADRNTDLNLFGLTMSAAQTQNFNPITIVLFAPVMSWLWLALAKRNWEPSIPIKFGLALVLVGAGFVLLAFSGHFAGSGFRVSLWWLVATYFLHSIAELCISPVGLSMITKLSIARVVGMMMGVWFLSISVAEYFAGAIAQAASVQTVGGQVTNAELSLHTYLGSFQTGGIATIAAGVLLLVLAPVLKRLMHGVR